MTNQTKLSLTKEQFETMRKIRKEISRLRQQLNNLGLVTNDKMIYEAEEQLAGAVDILNSFEEGDWL
jgi:hypothetical protein